MVRYSKYVFKLLNEFQFNDMILINRLEFRNLVRTFDTDLTFSSMIMADSFCHSEKARLNEFTTNKGWFIED